MTKGGKGKGSAEAGPAAWPATMPRMRKVSELVPYARNARTHSPEQIEQVAASIRQFGWTMPVLVKAEDSGIIAGHGRILAAALLGIDEVPTVEAVGWSDAQVRAYVLADNKLAENAGWDSELLAAELADLEALGFDVDLIGFSDDEMEALNPKGGGKTDPDEVPEPGPSPVSRAGDLWLCGPHRVYCGDSTAPESFEALMGGAMADACWTDPPYNVAVSKWDREGIKNDAMDGDTYAAFLLSAMVNAFAALKPGSAIYVAHAGTEGLPVLASFKSAGFKLSNCLVWAKPSFVVGRCDYHWQHEPILYGWKPGAAHRWYGKRKQTTLADMSAGTVFATNEDGSVTVRVGQESIIIRGDNLTAQPVEPTLIYHERPKRSPEHPTMKPVALIQRMLKNSTRVGDVVLDLFGGSGSTLIACHELGRHARLCELDPQYVDVIVKRWQDFTGETATLAADDRTFAAVSAEHFGKGRK